MEKSTQSNLCKGLRACGIPKAETHQILNTIQKWVDCSGIEWANDRVKALRQWYETCLAGEPKPPVWFKHSKEGYPLGIWKRVFDLPKAKALGVLSLNTVFYEKEVSQTQKEKFLHGLNGNGSQNPEFLKAALERIRPQYKCLPFKEMPEIQFPTVFDMNGSIPIHDGRQTTRPGENLGQALKALRSSWESVPQVTFDFLDRQDLLGYMPESVLGNRYQLELNRPHDRCVGRVSVIQQAQLKARIIGNPNRVTQVTLEPLKVLYMETARKLPSDVTHDQQSGVRWVQDKLRQGITLAGSDLTSASDLLDVGLCLKLVDATFGFPSVRGYEGYRDYFTEVSRSPWFCPFLDCEVQWKQGDVLGTGPSFGLLTLTNNACGAYAAKRAMQDGALSYEDARDSFRVVGDDIIMREEISPYYDDIIQSLGGEINHSKTITSDKVAEFAGKVITADGCYLKALKYAEPSDNSFMDFMAQLGDQAKFLLKPRQAKVYSLFKEVPGIAVNGPWMPDSYGIPLGPRYQWYLEEVQPALEAAEPDLQLSDYQMLLLKASLSLAEAGETSDEHLSFDVPLLDEGYLPSQVTPAFKVGGDPRLSHGKTKLDVLYEHVALKDIRPFSDWYEQNYQTTPQGSLESDSRDENLTSEDRAIETALQGLVDEEIRQQECETLLDGFTSGKVDPVDIVNRQTPEQGINRDDGIDR